MNRRNFIKSALGLLGLAVVAPSSLLANVKIDHVKGGEENTPFKSLDIPEHTHTLHPSELLKHTHTHSIPKGILTKYDLSNVPPTKVEEGQVWVNPKLFYYQVEERATTRNLREFFSTRRED